LFSFKPIKYVLLFASVLFACLLGFYAYLHSPLISNDKPAVIIRFEKHASASSLAQTLKVVGLVHSSSLVQFVLRTQGLSTQLKAGVYQVHPGEDLLHLLKRIVAGEVLIAHFAIIAGSTQEKINQNLQLAPYLTHHSASWLAIQGNYINAEGLVLADTYQYQGGSDSLSLLKQAHENLSRYLNKAWESRNMELPYKSPYELLIAASIIEKETALKEERPLIASVIVNRLKKNMPLQMDPTVIYGLGSRYLGKLTHQDLTLPSPYNTYRLRGLPPTPIAVVGKEAIIAAAHPSTSDYLYFVAKGDGSHQFSVSYAQHKQAIFISSSEYSQ
jgi:UPF0755 protein